ncbi:MAG: TolC family protein [Bacteroidota bacterium]
MKKLTLSFILAINFIALHAQEKWSLEKCVDHALSHNIQIKQRSLTIESTRTDVLQSKLSMLPDLNGFANHGYNFGQTVDRYTNQFATERVQTNNFNLSSTITLFGGFQKVNQLNQNMLNLNADQYDLDKFMDDISLTIATSYLQILFYQEILKNAENQLDITKQQVGRMQKMVDAGAAAQGDFYNLDAQRAAEELSLVDARNNLDMAYLTLTQLLDLPSSDNFEIEVPQLNVLGKPALVGNADEIFLYATQNQPDIKSAELRLQSSDLNISRARGAMMPSLSLNGSWGTGYSGASQIVGSSIPTPFADLPLIGVTKDENGNRVYDVYAYSSNTTYKRKPWNDQITDNNNKSISLNLSIPIFNGWQGRTSVSKARISVKNAEYTLESNKLNLRKTIQQAYADASAALKKYNSATTKVDASKESFKYSESKFNVGMLNSVDYNNAKKELEKAESELLQAKFEYIFKATVLDFYMGKPLTLKQ